MVSTGLLEGCSDRSPADGHFITANNFCNPDKYFFSRFLMKKANIISEEHLESRCQVEESRRSNPFLDFCCSSAARFEARFAAN